MSADYERKGLAEPFKGITVDGTVQKSYTSNSTKFFDSYFYEQVRAHSNQLVPPPDGLRRIQSLLRRIPLISLLKPFIAIYPHEVTILETAPPANLALAIRKNPTIVPLIKQIITMAGQMYVTGNAYLDNAEFHRWFDQEATQIVFSP